MVICSCSLAFISLWVLLVDPATVLSLGLVIEKSMVIESSLLISMVHLSITGKGFALSTGELLWLSPTVYRLHVQPT